MIKKKNIEGCIVQPHTYIDAMIISYLSVDCTLRLHVTVDI